MCTERNTLGMAYKRLWSKVASILLEQRSKMSIHSVKRSSSSRGVASFIEQNYVSLKKNNPKSPILIRECSGIQAKAFARYAFGREVSVSLDGLSTDAVSNAVSKLATE
ncbi:unnamed protein product, partial [Meganyctiphanes norvegica]